MSTKISEKEILLLGRIGTLNEEIKRLEKRNKEIYSGFMATTEELCESTKEIKRLNNIIKQQDTRNSRQRIANRKLLERNQDLVIENLKLNNIINELEKWLKEEIRIFEDGKDDEYEGLIYNAKIVILDKLQELKGDGSNDSKRDV